MFFLLCLTLRLALEIGLRLGSFQLSVKYREKTLPAFRFNVAHCGTNLLSIDIFNGLSFTLRDTTVADIHTVCLRCCEQWCSQ